MQAHNAREGTKQDRSRDREVVVVAAAPQEPLIPKLSAGRGHDSTFTEFFCGFNAAIVSICVTYPIHKTMFRQMSYGVNTSKAVQQLKQEGAVYLYRGVLPPLLQRTLSCSIMFGAYYKYRSLLEPKLPKITLLPISAALAGCTEALLTPLERIQVLLQDKRFNTQFKNTFHAVRELKKLGLKEFYRGVSAILIRNSGSNIIFFTLRTRIRRSFPKPPVWWREVAQDFVSGAVPAALISTTFYPVNVIKTKMQTTVGTRHLSLVESAKLVYQERGSIRKIYYGVHLNYTRSLLSWGIISATYELLRKILS